MHRLLLPSCSFDLRSGNSADAALWEVLLLSQIGPESSTATGESNSPPADCCNFQIGSSYLLIFGSLQVSLFLKELYALLEAEYVAQYSLS